MLQVSGRYSSLGVAVAHEGQTYRNVIKIAGGNITLYDGVHADDRIFVKLRKYDEEKDHELIVSQSPCQALYSKVFTHVPIYVAAFIGGERCTN